jgi:DNA-binding IclR family transcriptional regulator
MKNSTIDNIDALMRVLIERYPHGIALAELADEAAVQRDTAQRLLESMREHDWVRGIEHADGIRWTMGLGIARLGVAVGNAVVDRMARMRDEVNGLFPDLHAQRLQVITIAAADDGDGDGERA